MVDVIGIKNKIIEVLKKRGPSLPIQISKEVGVNSLFTSAFLSELLENKQIKKSNLKVGGSSLYFLEGQEEQLEKFYNYLHPKEIEAFNLLKNKKVIKDDYLIEPAIRVALRSIKDFSIEFIFENEVYWRYFNISLEEAIKIIKENYKKEKIEIPQEKEKVTEKETIILIPSNEKKEIISEITPKELPLIKTKTKTEQKDLIEKKPSIIESLEIKKEKPKELSSEFDNPLVPKTISKPRKEKPKSEFVLKVLSFLEKNNYKLIEEKFSKSKEFLGIVQINFDLGPINFYTIAKDKKRISDKDLKNHLIESQKIPIPALFLYTGELSKKAKEYQQQYFSILKTKKLDF